MRGVFRIYDEQESPKEAACLRAIYDEPKSPNERFSEGPF